MNSTLLDLGFFKIKWYSFFIFIGIIIASILIIKEYTKKDSNKEKLIDILFYGIIIGILGARIYYVLFNLEYYLIPQSCTGWRRAGVPEYHGCQPQKLVVANVG